MEASCVSCKNKYCKREFSWQKPKQNRLMLLSNYAVCVNKILTFINIQELQKFDNIWNNWFKIEKIINKVLMTGNKLCKNLKQPVFTYSTCGLFTKHCVVKEFKNLEKQVI